jgi:hypothetical protein
LVWCGMVWYGMVWYGVGLSRLTAAHAAALEHMSIEHAVVLQRTIDAAAQEKLQNELNLLDTLRHLQQSRLSLATLQAKVRQDEDEAQQRHSRMECIVATLSQQLDLLLACRAELTRDYAELHRTHTTYYRDTQTALVTAALRDWDLTETLQRVQSDHAAAQTERDSLHAAVATTTAKFNALQLHNDEVVWQHLVSQRSLEALQVSTAQLEEQMTSTHDALVAEQARCREFELLAHALQNRVDEYEHGMTDELERLKMTCASHEDELIHCYTTISATQQVCVGIGRPMSGDG